MTAGTTDTAFPFLTVLILLPAGAALVAAFVRARSVRCVNGGRSS